MSVVDFYINCPFNKAHRILKSRLQKHLCKCKKSYEQRMKKCCPFDPTHMLNPEEFEHHLSVCPSSGNIKCYQNSMEPLQHVGTISMEEACSLQTDMCNEDWSGNNPTYDPVAASSNKYVLVAPIGLSKAKRKQFKKQERNRLTSLEKTNPNNYTDSKIVIPNQPKFNEPLRVPKKAAKAVIIGENSKEDSSIDDLTSHVQDISIEKTSNSSSEKDASLSIVSVTSKKHNESGILKNTLSEQINVSTISRNTSQFEEKQNGNVSVTQQNMSAATGNTSKAENSFTKNRHVSQKDETEGNSKPCSSNHRLPLRVSKETKKISTGRGFTIAYQKLDSENSRNQEQRENAENFASVYGYDDDD